jgi:O-antigen biosynthesis protein
MIRKIFVSFVDKVFHKLGLDAFWSRMKLILRRGWIGVRQAIKRRICHGGLWQRYSEEAALLVSWLDYSEKDIVASREIHTNNPGEIPIRSITWFLPDFHHAYFGGIYTLLRFADYFHQHYQVHNQFVIVGSMKPEVALGKISSAFPELSDSTAYRINSFDDLSRLQPTDAAIATLWNTAYFLLRFNHARRKFYFMQDYEPLFYPAGSTYAQVDASFRFGFYGIANTPSIAKLYEEHSNGDIAEFFVPCVDTDVFHPADQSVDRGTPEKPYRVFFYGRPGHPRNSFELGVAALRILKSRLQERVEIISAGANWNPAEFYLTGIINNLGLLEFEQTAELYRTCDAGLGMMFTRHPSYLPFELMASGTLVVTNYNPATLWMLKDGENCLLSEPSPTCLAETLVRGLEDIELRKQIQKNALNDILTNYSYWDAQIEKIYKFMCAPSL